MEDIYITHVEIKNFQSHKDTSLEFVKGTNALVGSSNSGKTAVLRAIKWCLINVPNGDSFITTGEKESVVKVHLSNGKMIERRKDKSKVNLYRLHENGEVVDEFTGFGVKVPPPIIEAHGIVPIADNVYFQFADQLESAFMLSLKPKQRAEVLGDLEELGKIDRALGGVNDDLRADAKRLKQLAEEGKEFQANHEKLRLETERKKGKVEALKSLKEGIGSKLEVKDYLQKQLNRLSEIQSISIDIQTQIAKSERIVNKWPEDLEERIQYFKKQQQSVLRLMEIKQELEEIQFMKQDRLESLEKLKEEIESKVSRFNALSRTVETLRTNIQSQERTRGSFNERIAALDYGPVDLQVGKYKVLFDHLNQLRKIDSGIKETDELVKVAGEKIETLVVDFLDALHDAQLCPTCGQETEEVCKETVETIM